MVYSLLEMLRLSSPEEMSTKLLLMSQSPQICREMRQYGCLPLLIQLIHQQTNDRKNSNDKEVIVTQQELRERASKTFRNIIINSSKSRRELRVLRLIEDLRSFVDFLRLNGHELKDDFIDHPNSSVAYLLKVSFDEEHRNIIGLMGGVYAIAEVIQYDYEYHRNVRNNSCVTLRRYSLMALINLTFGDSQTKSLLATMKPFMKALVQNLESPAEELRQVVASLLRNLSWKADYITKQILREVGAVTYLTQAGLEATKESTLKSILSALWNLTAHCAPNKADFCKVEGALSFLISTLTYSANNNSITIVENGGGILRNISSHIVVNEEYREILRKHNTIAILLEQLKSTSITVVSNSCVTLWNLSARSTKDQQTLWELGAVPMLRNLTNSRHKMIAMGASATLKNLFHSPLAPNNIQINSLNSSTCSIPSLQARKLKAFKDDINCNLSETFDDIESPKVSPSHESYTRSSTAKTNVFLPGRMYTSFSGHINPHQVSRSSSHDSIGSTHSEPVTKMREVNQSLTSIYPFATQIMPQMYSTLSSNDSRNSDKELDISSDFDAFCGESNSQLNVSNASVKSSPFTDTELDVDPEPTDYSQRYKERPIDDFIAPRSNKPEVAGSEDSVKVYITEGTPLNFSLASSLSDLRDATLSAIDEEKNSILFNIENTENCISNELKEKSDEKKSNEIKPKVMFKKPIPPPKPKFSISPIKEIIDDKNCNKSQSETKTVTFVENGVKSSVSTNSIVSIDVCNENICEETPLMYSRSSSLASLSDCEVKSDICQGSIVSEFSRRTSEVVSPSDLPDSPLDSPRPSSPIPISTSKAAQNLSINEKENLINNEIQMNCDNNDIKSNEKTIENTVFEDKPISFATEDTPAVFSLSTSLSSLGEELNACNDNENNENKINLNEDNEKPMKSNENLEVKDIKIEINNTSSEDEGEDELLAACISSGMKNISNEKTISYNSLQRTDSKKVVSNSSPSKHIPIPQQRRSSNGCGPPLARSAPDGQSSYLEKDTLKVYGTEGTPVNFSKTSSISELSFSTIGKSPEMSVNHSDESEDEEILQKCIASGMTANRNQNTLTKNKRSPKTPKTTPNASPNTGNDKNEKKELNADQTRRFFVEDTPIQLSRCHSSLSSLSIESDDHFEDQKLLNEVIFRGMNQKKNTKISESVKQKITEKPKNTNLDEIDDTTTYTICHKSERSLRTDNKKINDNLMISSAMTDSSCLSDLDNMKPPSLMDNSMFSSTESFSYRQIAPTFKQIKKSEDSVVLLDNVKPPSLMEDISMSQSCASITSDISEIAFDTEVKNDKIAEMAKNCALRINSMTYSADNSESDTIDRICRSNARNRFISKTIGSKIIEYELSDTEVSEDLPVDNEEIKILSQNDIAFDFTTSSATLPLESPTICADVISDFDEENRIIRREKEILLSGRRISPIGSEDVLVDEQTSFVSDDSDPDTRATYNINSPRRPQIVRPVVRKNKTPKEELKLGSTQLSMSRPPIPTSRNKYTAKQTRTSALRASRSRSAETHFDDEIIITREKSVERHSYSVNRNKQYIDYMTESHSNPSFNNSSKPLKSNKIEEKEVSNKNKEKSLLSNMRSKLSSSLSSHNLGSSNASLSSNSSNGVTPSCASFSRRLEVQSRIASLWKRSKSSSNEKTTKNSNKDSDLSRSISARRSFGKSNKKSENTSLLRSSTYEKLPQSPEEANSLDTNHSNNKQTINYCDKYNNNNYIEKYELSQKRQQIDKTNGNSVYLSSKQSKSSKHRINNNPILNNNMINEKMSPSNNKCPVLQSKPPSVKPTSKSRRKCLVTAV